MTGPEPSTSRWPRWSWPVLAVLLVAVTAVAGYGLATRGVASGDRHGTATSAPTTADPAAAPQGPGGPGGTPPPPTGSGGGDPAPRPGPTAGSTGTTGQSPAPTTDQTTPTRPPQPRNWVIQWVLSLGPDAPKGPIITLKPYLLLLDRRCEEALASAEELSESNPAGAVYRGASNACLAAFHGQPQRWAAARRYLATALAGSGQLECAERATLEWLEGIVGLHDEDRSRTFVAAAPKGFYSGIERLAPDHGPAGTEVQVKGTNLDCVDEALLVQGNVEQRATLFHDPGGRSASFTAPEGLAPGRAEVVFRSGLPWGMGRATFTYEAGTAGSPPGG